MRDSRQALSNTAVGAAPACAALINIARGLDRPLNLRLWAIHRIETVYQRGSSAANRRNSQSVRTL